MARMGNATTADWFGGRVWDALTSGPLLGAGRTSSGNFLHAGVRWTVFLTTGPPRGPLTVNLAKPNEWLLSLPEDQAWQVDEERRLLMARDVLIALPRERLWSPLPAPEGKRDPQRALERVLSLQRILAARTHGGESTDLLRGLLMPGDGRAISPVASTYARRVWEIHDAISSADPTQLASALVDVLGLGQGLTPSGDDLVAGLLLAVHRWEPRPPASVSPSKIGHLVTAAHMRTTRLSANLIECAAWGEADERLLDLADHVWSGSPGEERAVDAVLGWGASSGVDALTGMALALLAEQPV